MRLVGIAAGLILSLPAAADPQVERGLQTFQERCVTCHSMECTRRGPKLEGILGKPAAMDAEYQDYTDALRHSGIVWDEATLTAFLAAPAALVPGTSMFLGGIDRIEDEVTAHDLMAFLRSGTSAGFCSKN